MPEEAFASRERATDLLRTDPYDLRELLTTRSAIVSHRTVATLRERKKARVSRFVRKAGRLAVVVVFLFAVPVISLV